MKFLFPTFLFALFAIAIPVIIHLFNFRKFKKVYFTNVKFLKEVKQETQSKSQLKHLLVLASRILAITFLVFAFAQPYIPSENQQTFKGDKVISVFVDNSFSMEAQGEQGGLFEEARKRAREIAEAFKPSDRFQLLTNDFEGRHQRLVNRDEFLNLLDETEISPSVKKISEIFSRQQDLLLKQEEKNKFAFIISDFQKSITDLEQVKADSMVMARMIPVSSGRASNLYIDSCWFESPVKRAGQVLELKVRVKNASGQDYENTPLSLMVNGQPKAPASIDIAANSSETISLPFTVNKTGINQGHVRITDYPVTYDDDFYFSFQVDEKLPVLVINAGKESPYLKGLFGKDDFVELANMKENNIDFSQFANQRLIVLNELKSISSGLSQELKKFCENGGSLLLVPSGDIDTESYRAFLALGGAGYYDKLDTNNMKVVKANTGHLIFSNVFESIPQNIDLPVSNAHYSLSKTSRSGEEVLFRLQNGDAFLARYPSGRGFVYLSAVPFSQGYSNFPKHALFVPVLYNIALFSQSQLPLFYTTGKDEMIENPKPELRAEIVKITASNNFEVIPAQRTIEGKQQLFVHGQVKTAGNFTLSAMDEPFGGISFNYDRAESILEYLDAEKLLIEVERLGLQNFTILNPQQKNMAQALDELNLGRRLWKLCIIFALVFLMVETLLLRYFRS